MNQRGVNLNIFLEVLTSLTRKYGNRMLTPEVLDMLDILKEKIREIEKIFTDLPKEKGGEK